MDRLKVRWDWHAWINFINLVDYIRQNSIQNAEKVRQSILNKVEHVRKHPEIHPIDTDKKKNPGNYRAFELYRFR